MRTDVWSFGGGKQSVAIAVYIAQGLLRKPERVVFADTGRESSLTWEYTRKHTIPLLQSIGLELEIVSHDYARVDLYGGNGDLLIPAFTSTGKLPTFCSSEWKQKPVRRYLREHGFAEGSGKDVTMWFGMSLDEVHRLRVSDVDWIENYYPLCFTHKRRRQECVDDIIKFGLPEPPKSACWMCPHRNSSEWLEQSMNAPEDHVKALELDREIRKNDSTHSVFVHYGREPLIDTNLHQPDKPKDLFGDCADVCWT